ncbi:MAG: hypothetical protein EZS28_032838 [Streblomastix strix]|uniref:Uncharacterized protein n=1 Tax=Streblomastix strix TaxID=222440 RepID=A0A5J4UPH0_9EUKA|nr:MAG: hypothetical protein EZS28_032838 [Streblomastix strix]
MWYIYFIVTNFFVTFSGLLQGQLHYLLGLAQAALPVAARFVIGALTIYVGFGVLGVALFSERVSERFGTLPHQSPYLEQ